MAEKILNLYIESCGGVINKEINTLEKSVIAIIADGGLGKSSIMAFIKAMTTGEVPEELINNVTGQMKGNLVFTKNGKKYTVTCSKTKKSETFKIKSDDGFSGGKEVLRNIIGPIAIDPFRLKRLDPDKQTLELKKMAKIDTASFDARHKDKKEERLQVGRDVKALEGFLITDTDNTITLEQKIEKYKEEKPLGDLPDQLKAAQDFNDNVIREKGRLESGEYKLETLENLDTTFEKEIDRLYAQIKEIELQIKAKEQEQQANQQAIQQGREFIETQKKWLEDNQPKDLSAIQAQIDDVKQFNNERSSFQIYVEKFREKERKEKLYDELTAEMENITREKEKYVQEVLGSIEGFEFREPVYDETGKICIDDREGPYFNGKSLRQLSTTELLKWSVLFRKAIDRREGRDSSLPVFIFDDAESMGSEAMAEIEKLIHEPKQEGEIQYQAFVAFMDREQKDVKVVVQNHLVGLNWKEAQEKPVVEEGEEKE